jgi:hypothetical protein
MGECERPSRWRHVFPPSLRVARATRSAARARSSHQLPRFRFVRPLARACAPSRNNALLTLLISNNFVELKGSVFRRFESENLFQVACADTVERFQLGLFLLLIALQDLASLAALRALMPSLLAIFFCEMVVDHVKHSFITKFNRLHADLYRTFSAILSQDLLSARHRMRTSLDPTHTSAKRLGLATLPLTVVVVRMGLLKLDPRLLPRLTSVPGLAAYALVFACLFAFKTLLGMLLQAHAAGIIAEQRVEGAAATDAAAELQPPPQPQASAVAPPPPAAAGPVPPLGLPRRGVAR